MSMAIKVGLLVIFCLNICSAHRVLFDLVDVEKNYVVQSLGATKIEDHSDGVQISESDASLVKVPGSSDSKWQRGGHCSCRGGNGGECGYCGGSCGGCGNGGGGCSVDYPGVPSNCYPISCPQVSNCCPTTCQPPSYCCPPTCQPPSYCSPPTCQPPSDCCSIDRQPADGHLHQPQSTRNQSTNLVDNGSSTESKIEVQGSELLTPTNKNGIEHIEYNTDTNKNLEYVHIESEQRVHDAGFNRHDDEDANPKLKSETQLKG